MPRPTKIANPVHVSFVIDAETLAELHALIGPNERSQALRDAVDFYLNARRNNHARKNAMWAVGK